MTNHLETHGSTNLRVLFMNDERGKMIKTDSLFENLYDFCTSYHDRNKSLFYWYGHKIWKLEMSIKRKQSKDLPLVNIIIKKFKEKDEFFNPDRFLEEFDQEKYFELLKAWKTDVQKSYLDENPLLHFSPLRHEKCLMSKRRPCTRQIFFCIL